MRAGGATNMHLTVQQGRDLLETRNGQYRSGGAPYFRPIMVLFGDGLLTGPRGEMEQANQRLEDMESGSRLTIFKVGVKADAVQAMIRVLPNPNSLVEGRQRASAAVSSHKWDSRSLGGKLRRPLGNDSARCAAIHLAFSRMDLSAIHGYMEPGSSARQGVKRRGARNLLCHLGDPGAGCVHGCAEAVVWASQSPHNRGIHHRWRHLSGQRQGGVVRT